MTIIPDRDEYQPGDQLTDAEQLAAIRRWWPTPPATGDPDTPELFDDPMDQQ